MKLSIVIPVYNEKNTINEILYNINKVILPIGISKKEIIIVDDFSTDGTRDILKNINDNDIKIFYHENNKGKGAALRTGFKKITGDIVIIQDADLEYDPNEYSKLLKPIIDGKADVVYGSRFVGSESHRILYFWHSIANKILTLLSNMFADLNLTDMETCYKVFRKNIVDKIEIEEDRFGFEPEITAKISELARLYKIRIYEVGISYYGRTLEDGKKIGLKDAFRAFWCIFKYNTSKFAHLVKYGFNGLFVALSQLLTITILIEVFGKNIINTFNNNQILLENIANIISIEVSIICGFFLHSFITWRYKLNNIFNFLMKFMLFHFVTIISALIRSGLFYILSQIRLNYQLNALIGIFVAIIINFFGYDKIVFKIKNNK